ncbi:thioesterase II family protein [Streptomyces sp. NPDC012389]|uniref:thioesterase II family protein n=1 Tax=Streptomyces sp. NPDC012389 TaxID=3364830 RepID=UPI0036E06514
MSDGSGTKDKWICRFHDAPQARVRLVCLPHAGGSASFFFNTSRALSPEIEVLAVQYPGRMDRYAEPLVDDMSRLADLVTDSLLPLTGRPLALFGHSMGASLSFEVARRLERRGVPPFALVVSGRPAPHRLREGRLHLGSDEQLIAEIARLNGTVPAFLDDAELLDMWLPVIRTDYQVIEKYRYEPGPPLTVPITAHVGLSDPKAPIEDVRAWEEHTTGAFALHTHPGGHFYLGGPDSPLFPHLARLPEAVPAVPADRPAPHHG